MTNRRQPIEHRNHSKILPKQQRQLQASQLPMLSLRLEQLTLQLQPQAPRQLAPQQAPQTSICRLGDLLPSQGTYPTALRRLTTSGNYSDLPLIKMIDGQTSLTPKKKDYNEAVGGGNNISSDNFDLVSSNRGLPLPSTPNPTSLFPSTTHRNTSHLQPGGTPKFLEKQLEKPHRKMAKGSHVMYNNTPGKSSEMDGSSEAAVNSNPSKASGKEQHEGPDRAVLPTFSKIGWTLKAPPVADGGEAAIPKGMQELAGPLLTSAFSDNKTGIINTTNSVKIFPTTTVSAVRFCPTRYGQPCSQTATIPSADRMEAGWVAAGAVVLAECRYLTLRKQGT